MRIGHLARTLAGTSLLLWAALAAAAQRTSQPAAGPRVPVIYSTDLYHPHQDLDDHFDLAQLFALPELDVRGIVLDINGRLDRSGRPAIEQMMRLTRRRVPWAVGLKDKLGSLDDAGLGQPAEFQKGVALILKALREAESPVTIVATGSVRDIVAAYRRKPELLRAKCSRLYLNVGNARDLYGEHNVNLDPLAYRVLLQSGLPVCWCPCYPKLHKGATYWLLRYGPMFRPGGAPVGLQNYFLYAMRRLDPAKVPAAAIFDGDFRTRSGATALPDGRKAMWCTPSLLAAAGRKVYRTAPDRWVAAHAPPPGGRQEGVFRFVPVRVEFAQNGKLRSIAYHARAGRMTALWRPDPALYAKAMTSVLLDLYRRFPVAGAKEPAGGSPGRG